MMCEFFLLLLSMQSAWDEIVALVNSTAFPLALSNLIIIGFFIYLYWYDRDEQNKYEELTDLVSDAVTLSDGASTTIQTQTNVTGTYKHHFTVPAIGKAHILVTRENYSNWESDIQDDQLIFKTNVIQYQTSSSAENQFAMMDLAERVLLHSSSINAALTTTPTTVNITTNTTTSTAATEANQEAILELLERVLMKLSALREVF